MDSEAPASHNVTGRWNVISVDEIKEARQLQELDAATHWRVFFKVCTPEIHVLVQI